jgi:hypothetical protein
MSFLIGKKKYNLQWNYLEETVKLKVCNNKGNVIHAYLGYDVIDIQKQLTEIASLVKMSGKGTSVVYSTLCINKGIL